MTWDKTPWFIGGGAEHSPETLRAFAYAATGGAEGVAAPTDLKVQAFFTPGGGVRVVSGGCVMLNRYPGGNGQSYTCRLPDYDDVAVNQTGATPRSDLIVATVQDPQYPGVQPVTDPATAQYVFTRRIPGVPAGTTTAAQLNLGYPAIELARIDMPANTATVQPGFIKDLRKLARPRRQRELMITQPSGAAYGPGDGWTQWPIWAPEFTVPTWATTLTAVMTLSGIYKPAGGLVLGEFRLEYAQPLVPGLPFAAMQFEEYRSTQESRTMLMTAGETSVLGAGGQVRTIRMAAHRIASNSDVGANIYVVPGSNLVLDVEFQERIG